VINPGSQTLPPLTLKPLKPTTIDLNFSFVLQLLNFPDAPVTIPAEPPAMRTLLQTYRCQSCHNSGARPFAGLDLQSYPYKNTAGESLAQILSTLIKSFTGSDGVPKMPPSNVLVKDEDAAIVRNFLQTVNEANSADKQKWVQDVRLSLDLGEPERFESALTLQDGVYTLSNRIRVVAGSKYTYSLTIYGLDGSRLYEVIDGALEVPGDGKVQLKGALDYKTLGSTLPVIVGQ
jgi:mono/diheme cytochrome c family protein